MKAALRSPITWILLFTLARGWLFALTVPYRKAPDEPAHFNYVMHLKNNWAIPVHYYHPGAHPIPQSAVDPDANALEGAATYCSVHAPLYYALCAIPVRLLTTGPWTAAYLCRLLSVLMMTVTVYIYFLIARRILPDDPLLHLVIPLLASLVPQFTLIGSTVSNDNLVNLLAALLCLVWTGALLDGVTWRSAVRMGYLSAFWYLTKGSYPIAIVMSICVIAVGIHRHRQPMPIVAYLLTLVIVGSPYAIRNHLLFGSINGLQDNFAFWTAGSHLFPSLFSMITGIWATGVFKSFWATFDWMVLLLPHGWIYRVLLWVSVLSVPMTIYAIARRRKEPEAFPLVVLLIFGILTIGALAAFCYYLPYQPQGRHLFPALFPIMTCIAMGLGAIPGRKVALFLAVAALAWLNLYGLYGVIVPFYT